MLLMQPVTALLLLLLSSLALADTTVCSEQTCDLGLCTMLETPDRTVHLSKPLTVLSSNKCGGTISHAVSIVGEPGDGDDCFTDYDKRWCAVAEIFGDGNQIFTVSGAGGDFYASNIRLVEGSTANSGGAVFVDQGAKATLVKLVLMRNEASNGGAVSALRGATLYAIGLYFVDNHSTYNGGGAVSLRVPSTDTSMNGIGFLVESYFSLDEPNTAPGGYPQTVQGEAASCNPSWCPKYPPPRGNQCKAMPAPNVFGYYCKSCKIMSSGTYWDAATNACTACPDECECEHGVLGECVLEPTAAPTSAPSQSPTASPSQSPSPAPTASPSQSPSSSPSAAPSASPTQSPSTASPTTAPTASPSQSPSPAPSSSPTKDGTTLDPTSSPTAAPSPSPTAAPTAPTAAPSPSPTAAPTRTVDKQEESRTVTDGDEGSSGGVVVIVLCLLGASIAGAVFGVNRGYIGGPLARLLRGEDQGPAAGGGGISMTPGKRKLEAPASPLKRDRSNSSDELPPEAAEEFPPMTAPYVGKRVTVIGTSRDDLNGSTGLAASFDAAKGRYNVDLDGGKGTIALKPNNVKPMTPSQLSMV